MRDRKEELKSTRILQWRSPEREGDVGDRLLLVPRDQTGMRGNRQSDSPQNPSSPTYTTLQEIGGGLGGWGGQG